MATLMLYAAGLFVAFLVLALVAFFMLIDRNIDKKGRD